MFMLLMDGLFVFLPRLYLGLSLSLSLFLFDIWLILFHYFLYMSLGCQIMALDGALLFELGLCFPLILITL